MFSPFFLSLSSFITLGVTTQGRKHGGTLQISFFDANGGQCTFLQWKSTYTGRIYDEVAMMADTFQQGQQVGQKAMKLGWAGIELQMVLMGKPRHSGDLVVWCGEDAAGVVEEGSGCLGCKLWGVDDIFEGTSAELRLR